MEKINLLQLSYLNAKSLHNIMHDDHLTIPVNTNGEKKKKRRNMTFYVQSWLHLHNLNDNWFWQFLLKNIDAFINDSIDRSIFSESEYRARHQY